MAFDILQIVLVLAIMFLLVPPVGTYMAAVFTGKRTWLDPVLNPVDNAIYRISGVNPHENQRWPAYVKAVLLVNLYGPGDRTAAQPHETRTSSL